MVAFDLPLTENEVGSLSLSAHTHTLHTPLAGGLTPYIALTYMALNRQYHWLKSSLVNTSLNASLWEIGVFTLIKMLKSQLQPYEK